MFCSDFVLFVFRGGRAAGAVAGGGGVGGGYSFEGGRGRRRWAVCRWVRENWGVLGAFVGTGEVVGGRLSRGGGGVWFGL